MTNRAVRMLIFKLSPEKELARSKALVELPTKNHLVPVVLLSDGPDLIQQGVGLVALSGYIGNKHQTGPVLAPQLLQAHVQLLLEIVYLIGLFPR